MGYETALILVGVRPPRGRLAQVKRALKRMQREEAGEAAYIFRHLAILSDGTIEFNSGSFEEAGAALDTTEVENRVGRERTRHACGFPRPRGKQVGMDAVPTLFCAGHVQGAERVVRRVTPAGGPPALPKARCPTQFVVLSAPHPRGSCEDRRRSRFRCRAWPGTSR
jgi:hypothetical protein